MNRTRDLLYRPAGGVESKKNSRSSSTNNNNNNSDGNHHSSSTSPRKSSQDSGSHHNSRGSGNEEGQKWKQRLTDNKLFKRLLQPTHVGMDKNTSGHRGASNGNSGSYETSSSSRDGTVVPRLGEVPARSKYFRPEQQNSHFANTADYLPLAEMCGPPVQSANTYSTHNEADDTDRAEARHRRASDEEGSPTTPRHTKKHRSRSSRKRRHRHRAHHESHDAEAPYDGMEEAYEAPTDFDEDANFSDEGEESEEGDETTDDDDNDGDEERNHFHHGADAEGAEVAYEGDGDQDVDFGFDEADDEGHYNHPTLQQQQQQQQQQSGRPEESGLREKFVRAIPGSVQRRQYGSSTGSATSAASSVGPTGLALMPQFRWVPRPGGGGHGFNPFMAYRRPLPQQQQQQQQQQQRYYTSDQRASPANLPSPSHPTDHRAVSPVSPFHPPPQQQQEEDGKLTANLSSVGARHSSFDMFYGTPSPSPQQRDAASPMYNTFYGPIGTLGIEASRRRRQLELEHGSAGDAEKAYKARTSRRSSRFDDGSILLITKAWCDPEMLLSARVVDSPRLPADIDEDDEDGGGSAANMMDWDDDSDDAAATGNDDNKDLNNNNNNNNNANKPPVYDAATMAAREARVRKERIRQEKLRSQTADSPSFYFAGAELAGLKVPPPDESSARKSTPASPVGAGRGAATPRAAAGAAAAPLPAAPSPPAHARGSPPSVMTGVAASKASPLKESNDKHDHDIDDEARSYSSSSSSKSSDNGNNSSGDDEEEDEDDDDDSNSNSDSDSRSDGSSNSESDNETDYAESDAGGRSPRDDSITRAPAHGAKKGRAPPRHRRSSSSGHGHAPDVSISAGPGVTIGRSVVGEPGQYDFMNSSMIDGPGGSLFFPHDDNEGSVVATALPAPLTPFNRPGNAYTPIHGANNSSSDRAGPPVYTNSINTLHNATTTATATAAAPPKSATSNVLSPVANPTVAGGKDRDPLTERPASGNGVTAANALREMKRVKKFATDTRAGTGTQQQQQQQQQQQRGVQNASATGEDGGAAGMSAYGSSFHLKDGRPLYTPADEGEVVPGTAPYSPALLDSRATTQSPQRSTPGQRRSSDAYGTAGGAAASPKLTTPKSAASAPASMVGASAGAATAGHGTNANRRGSTTSPGDYMMSIRDIPPTPDVHANRRPSESPVGFSTSTAFRGPSTTPAVHNTNTNNTSGQAGGDAPSRNPTVSPSLYSTTSTNGAARRTSTTSPAGISVSTAGGYNTRPSSLAPAISPPHGSSASRPVSLTPQPPTDGRRFSHGGGGVPSTNLNNYHSSNARVDLTLSAKPAAAGWPATTSPTAGGGGYYAPMTPPGTPKNTTATRGVRENAAAASPVGRVSANKSVTPGLGESTHFNDHGYELPGM